MIGTWVAERAAGHAWTTDVLHGRSAAVGQSTADRIPLIYCHVLTILFLRFSICIYIYIYNIYLYF